MDLEKSNIYDYYATVFRMRYINRWSLMRNTREENLAEHSSDVALIAHSLCVIGNIRYGKNLNADRAAVIGLLHDTSEIITGDMPTPVKYFNPEIRDAYKKIEAYADRELLNKLPEDMKESYQKLYFADQSDPDDLYIRRLIKAADKLSALIKCIEELKTGNMEFKKAFESTEKSLKKLTADLPEVGDFMRDFLPAYSLSLDELS
ncbi:MAG: 5'-deoxynucleotidase [Lachnospiraceae bacterium]|nr:5'-deoxynucleotidase [Lachnospiraceae bacterium]